MLDQTQYDTFKMGHAGHDDAMNINNVDLHYNTKKTNLNNAQQDSTIPCIFSTSREPLWIF